MRRIKFSLVIVLMMVVMALLAANLPPAKAIPDPLTLECDVSPNVTKVGQEIDCRAAASGGVPGYNWSWTVNGGEIATTQNTTHTFATAGNYTVCVNVTDSSGNWTQCCTPVTVDPALSLECWVSPNVTKVNHATNFSAAASGGVPPYSSWLWTVNGAPVAGTQNTTYYFTAAGNYNICVNVTDSSGNWTQCCTNVTVNPAITLECDISPNVTKVNHATNFSATASGGVPPYSSWLWTVNGAPVAGAQNTTYNFTAAGNYTVCVNVTDSLGNKEQCCVYNFTVNPTITLECDISPDPTKVNHATNFSAAASGGVPPYSSWLWTVNGAPVAGAQNTTYYFTAAGDYTVCVNVTDSLGNKDQCCTNVTVNPALILECNVSPNLTKVGHVTNFTAAASGGVPPYSSWLWTVNGAPVAGAQNTTYNFTAAGDYTVCVNVTDSLENEMQCCTNVTVNPALILECDVSPNPTEIGNETDFRAAASGGIPPYLWLWTVNGAPVAGAQNTTYNFTAAGNYTVCVNVTDSLENEMQCCTNVTVNPALILECDISPNPTKVGHVTNFRAAASGGIPPYLWLWTVNGAPVAGAQNTTYNFTAAGNYTVCVNVTDFLGNKDQCCTPVTVNPALSLVLWPKTDTNPVGTFHVITATLYDQYDEPKPYVNLTWNISGVGDFSGTPGGITNDEGQAYAEITSSQTGTSTVTCEVAGNTSIYDTATKTWVVRKRPSGGGGGCPPIKYLTVDWEGRNTTERLLANDELSLDLLGLSPDGCHSLLLEQGTSAPVVDGETYYLIVIRKLELGDIPPLPDNTIAILAVGITPTGAVFNKDVILTLCFDQLPENALEGTITIAYYNGVSGVWVPQESTQGERDGMLTLSAAIDHFTIFAVLVEVAPSPPPPAHFVASGLSIETSEEKIWETITFVTKTGENVAITANVANDGGQEGTYTVVLKLDGETVDTEIVTLGAGQSQQVSFTVFGLDYGQHEVEVDGLSGEFTTSRTITWWLIIVIIVAIGLIVWGVIWWRRRRRRRAAQV